MQIGELAARSGLSHDTLRFYQRQGLLSAARDPNGYRRYGPDSEARLSLIRLGQGLGFSLAEIRAVLAQLAALEGADAGLDVQQLLQQKLAEIDARLATLQGLRAQLAQQLGQRCPLRLATAPAPAEAAA